MVLHLASAAADKAVFFQKSPVAGAARNRRGFENVDSLALHLTVADQKACGSKAGKSRANDICGFFVNALGLAGVGERLIVPVAVKHICPSLFFAQCNMAFKKLSDKLCILYG